MCCNLISENVKRTTRVRSAANQCAVGVATRVGRCRWSTDASANTTGAATWNVTLAWRNWSSIDVVRWSMITYTATSSRTTACPVHSPPPRSADAMCECNYSYRRTSIYWTMITLRIMLVNALLGEKQLAAQPTHQTTTRWSSTMQNSIRTWYAASKCKYCML